MVHVKLIYGPTPDQKVLVSVESADGLRNLAARRLSCDPGRVMLTIKDADEEFWEVDQSAWKELVDTKETFYAKVKSGSLASRVSSRRGQTVRETATSDNAQRASAVGGNRRRGERKQVNRDSDISPERFIAQRAEAEAVPSRQRQSPSTNHQQMRRRPSTSSVGTSGLSSDEAAEELESQNSSKKRWTEKDLTLYWRKLKVELSRLPPPDPIYTPRQRDDVFKGMLEKHGQLFPGRSAASLVSVARKAVQGNAKVSRKVRAMFPTKEEKTAYRQGKRKRPSLSLSEDGSRRFARVESRGRGVQSHTVDDSEQGANMALQTGFREDERARRHAPSRATTRPPEVIPAATLAWRSSEQSPHLINPYNPFARPTQVASDSTSTELISVAQSSNATVSSTSTNTDGTMATMSSSAYAPSNVKSEEQGEAASNSDVQHYAELSQSIIQRNLKPVIQLMMIGDDSIVLPPDEWTQEAKIAISEAPISQRSLMRGAMLDEICLRAFQDLDLSWSIRRTAFAVVILMIQLNDHIEDWQGLDWCEFADRRFQLGDHPQWEDILAAMTFGFGLKGPLDRCDSKTLGLACYIFDPSRMKALCDSLGNGDQIGNDGSLAAVDKVDRLITYVSKLEHSKDFLARCPSVATFLEEALIKIEGRKKFDCGENFLGKVRSRLLISSDSIEEMESWSMEKKRQNGRSCSFASRALGEKMNRLAKSCRAWNDSISHSDNSTNGNQRSGGGGGLFRRGRTMRM